MGPGSVLIAAGRYGRILLVAGLGAGFLLPGVAGAMRPWLPALIAALMFLAALRIGPRQAIGALRDLPSVLGVVAVYQLAVPLALAAGFGLAGLGGSPAALAVILMASAPPIAGSPNLTVLSGGDPAPALRLLVVATACLPVTVLPVFFVAEGLGGAGPVLAAAGRLLGVIALAGGAAFLIRGIVWRAPAPRSIAMLDGLSALAMVVVVVGLMAKAGPTLLESPLAFLAWLTLALAANLGAQVVAFLWLGRTRLRPQRTGLAISAGNRNIALFLVALPAEVTGPILLFIGCYQIPMYLTPILMGRLYRG
ncbi:hypothetical protein RGUI_0204 [Rhodovulum sp. P5]|uniref:hypothetical protein n=1 Tax=Rhodovulum sp. P5 TaxID=1564506 RepID=UPI0009C2722D|nr:hypothetical protein [Rhodovulum sp. P5]ARE38345.1 hypothetical protein RGUI_0204 [Rhodovulum sp. P5]